jgi:hypothetical protein
MDESQLESYSEALQADDRELALELAKYDIDAALIAEYDALYERTQNLKVNYQP